MTTIWDGIRIRGLRLRMGWSRSDLARRLSVKSEQVSQWEMDLESPSEYSEAILEMLFNLADSTAEEVACVSLSENFFSEGDLLQVDRITIRRKFLDQ